MELLEQFYRVNQAAGVSINVKQDGAVVINTCVIVTKSKRLDFIKKVTALERIEQLAKELPAKSFVALNLSGKAILHKRILKVETVEQNEFNKILPNAKIDDFYVQHFVSGNHSFVSLVRRTVADQWISELAEQGFIPLTLSLGPFPVSHIQKQLNIYDKEMVFDGHLISIDEEDIWQTYSYDEALHAPFPLKIESEGINEQLVVPYAAAFQLTMALKLDPIKAEIPVLDIEMSNLEAKKKLQVKGMILMLIFFILLLFNFILFSSLQASNSQLSEKVSESSQSLIDVQGINEQVKQKENLIQVLGWDGGINKTALIDQLASLLPEELSWQEVSINPVDKASSRIQKSLTFFSQQIRITGMSERIIPVNEWIARIKTRPWVKNVQLDNYIFNNELNTGEYTVIITY